MMILEVLISASRMTVTGSIPLFNTLLGTAACPVAHFGSCRGAVGLGVLDFHETRVNSLPSCQESIIMLIPSLRCN